MKKTMFWQWLRWQCLNLKDLNNGEIPKGTVIDDDEFVFQIVKMQHTHLGLNETCHR